MSPKARAPAASEADQPGEEGRGEKSRRGEKPVAEGSPKRPEFLTIKDLAERWGVSIVDAKSIVRDEKVPFMALKSPGPAGSMRLCWKFLRFELPLIEEWEARRRKVSQPPAALVTRLPVSGRPILRRS